MSNDKSYYIFVCVNFLSLKSVKIHKITQRSKNIRNIEVTHNIKEKFDHSSITINNYYFINKYKNNSSIMYTILTSPVPLSPPAADRAAAHFVHNSCLKK